MTSVARSGKELSKWRFLIHGGRANKFGYRAGTGIPNVKYRSDSGIWTRARPLLYYNTIRINYAVAKKWAIFDQNVAIFQKVNLATLILVRLTRRGTTRNKDFEIVPL